MLESLQKRKERKKKEKKCKIALIYYTWMITKTKIKEDIFVQYNIF